MGAWAGRDATALPTLFWQAECTPCGSDSAPPSIITTAPSQISNHA